MGNRRDFLVDAAAAAAALGLAPLAVRGDESAGSRATVAAGQPASTPARAPAASTVTGTTSARDGMITRTIPSSGEPVPVIGMGTSGTFEVGTSGAELDPLREVLALFVASGATVIDTAPTYGAAEDVLGSLLAERPHPDLFLATKLSRVVGRAAGFRQFGESLRRLRTDKVALLQVHNLGDTETQLGVARELKAQGKVRYVGLTHYVESAQAELAAAMRRLKPDFVQINYSPVSRGAEQAIFPVARDLGIAVMINRAFEDGRLFAQVRGKSLPAWASEVGADSWAQLFLKFVLSEPAVTVVIPATSKPRNMTDNLRAGVGALLDSAQRADLVATLG